jgi:acetoin utilization protein AcuB
MTAEDLINHSIPVLRPTDSVSRALDVMQDCGIHQLVLIEDGQLKAILTEDTLLNWFNDEDTLGTLPIDGQPMSGNIFQHIYELINLANIHQLQIVPILDEDNSYIGCIVVTEMLAKFAEQLGVQDTGAVVVLKMNDYDYSLTDISRLVESNNTKIISSFFAKNPVGFADATLTLKLNRTDISPVVATLERFGYNIEGTYADSGTENLDQNRLHSLLRYLEV